MKIQAKMSVGFILPLLVGSIIVLTIMLVILNQQTNAKLSELRTQQEQAIESRLKAQLMLARQMIADCKANGGTKEDCLKLASSFKYGDGSYIWIHTFDPNAPTSTATMLSHPTKALIGKDLAGLVDKDTYKEQVYYRGKLYAKNAPEVAHIPAKKLFLEMNQTCLKDGSGVVRYYWYKSSDKEKKVGYLKLSYVLYFPEWHWVLGMGEYADNIDQAVAVEAQQLHTKTSQLFWTIVIGIGCLTVGMIAIAYLLSRNISSPIQLITEMNRRFALGETDLSPAQEKELAAVRLRKDELGEISTAFHELRNYMEQRVQEAACIADGDLSHDVVKKSQKDVFGTSFQAMTDSLNGLITNVNSASVQINAGSAQVADASQSLSQGATEQAASLEEISSSMSEIGKQTKDSAANATQVSQLAATARSAAVTGNSQMAELSNAMHGIRESSQEISKIIKTIDDIAFQTNLLALNAAVEAARAGRHGKGFAVVAEEVRNLAGRSAKAADETTQLINDAVARVENGTKVTDETAASLREIEEIVDKVSVLVEEIATAADQQAQGVSEIVGGLGQIDSVTQQNTANAEETAAAAEELSSQASLLRELLARFKLRGNVLGASQPTQLPPPASPPRAPAPQQSQLGAAGWADTAVQHKTAHQMKTPEQFIALDDNEFGKF